MSDAQVWPRGPGARFITLEGVDGAGKTSQIRRLAEHLRVSGAEVVETREPGGAPGSEAIRELLVSGDPGRWSGETETLLFTAARRHHVERVIGPALARGATVVCDRYVDSTRAYQGARGVGRGRVDALHALCIGLVPDLTLILDIDPVIALARGKARGGPARFEAMGLEFQRRLREAFRAIAVAEPHRCKIIDAGGEAGAVAGRVAAALA